MDKNNETRKTNNIKNAAIQHACPACHLLEKSGNTKCLNISNSVPLLIFYPIHSIETRKNFILFDT
jgi:hypothetical protein